MKKIFSIATAFILGMGMLCAADNADKNLKVIELKFAENMKFNWPFSKPDQKLLGTTVDPTKNSLGTKLLNKEFDYVTDEGGYVFKATASKYNLSNPRLGWRLNGNVTIKLPVLSGMTLVSVTLVDGNAGTFGRAVIARDGELKAAPGGEAVKKTVPALTPYTWTLTESKPGEQYCITLPNEKAGIDIKEMMLIYAKKQIPMAYQPATGKAKDGDGTYETLQGSFIPIFADGDDFTCGFDYKKPTDKKWTSVTSERPGKNFSCKITGLKMDSRYVYRAWVCAPGSKTKKYGEEKEFSTSEAVVTLDFTDKSAMTGFPSNREGIKLANKITEKTFATDQSFKIWAEYGFAMSTSNGQPMGLAMNPAKKVEEEFDFGGQGNGWIKIPGLQGRKLTNIEIIFTSGVPGKFNVSSQVTEGVGTKDLVSPFKVTNKNNEISLPIDNMEKGAGCYICAEGTYMAIIKSIKLTYEF